MNSTEPEMNTQQKVIALRELAIDGGKNLFRRCVLLSEIMSDRDFIASDFEGDEGAARAHFEEQFFSDVSGWCTIDQLISLVRAFPNEAIWENVNYRLPDLRALYDEAHQSEHEPIPRVSWKSRATEAEDRAEQLRAQIAVRDRQLEEQAAKIENLQRQIYRLEDELARVKTGELVA
jgi:hypothetical protein